jgi:hypothetical protein
MIADLVLLSCAFAFLAAALAWMAVLLWRVACDWFDAALDGAAGDIR